MSAPTKEELEEAKDVFRQVAKEAMDSRRIQELEDALGFAAAKFRQYEQMHKAKKTPEAMYKAGVNAGIAQILEIVLYGPEPEEENENS